jgi:putative ABC transport system substrate-binding protein
MRRRDFIAGVGGAAAAAWPRAVRAQQSGRMRLVGALIFGTEADRLNRQYTAALSVSLEKVGWIEGRNLRTEIRFGGGNAVMTRTYAAELVSLAPDVIVGQGGPATRALQQETQSIPIVFVAAGDVLALRIVTSLSHPEGNATGITNNFASFGGKWLELLKEAAPRLAAVAILFKPEAGTADLYLASIEKHPEHLASRHNVRHTGTAGRSSALSAHSLPSPIAGLLCYRLSPSRNTAK